MSIRGKPQRFWYLKSHDTIMNFAVHWTLLSLRYLSVYYSWNLLWRHSGCIPLGWSGSWSVFQDHSHVHMVHQRTNESVTRADSSVPLMHQWPWITDPDPDNPKEMHPLSLLNLLLNITFKWNCYSYWVKNYYQCYKALLSIWFIRILLVFWYYYASIFFPKFFQCNPIVTCLNWIFLCFFIDNTALWYFTCINCQKIVTH